MSAAPTAPVVTMRPRDVAGVLPPHDLDAERALVACAYHAPAVLELAAGKVSPRDFYSEQHALIFRELLTLRAEGEPTDDAPTLICRLRATASAETVAYASRIVFDETRYTGTIDRAARYVDAVADAALRRRTIATLQQAASIGYHAEPGEWREQIAGMLAEVTTEARGDDAPGIVSAHDRALTVGGTGARIPTGFGTLDHHTRGGIPLGRILFLVGAPGAAKTGLAATISRTAMLMSGAAVGFHAADEPAEAIAMRLGQSEGIDRGAMEAGDGDARAALAAAMDGPFRRLLLVDQDEDELTLDDTVEALVAAHPDVPKVLVVDSVQTVAIRNPPRSESKREQIDAVVSRIKLLTKRHGLLTIVTSESNRAFYRSKRADEQSSALSAAAESRSIEYAATVLLTLRSASGVPNEVDVEIAKSRLGGRGETFRFRWDEVRALASEVAGSTGSTGSATPNRFEIVKAKVLEVVGQFDCDSATAVYGRTGGTKGVVLQAVRELRRDGTIVEVGGFLRVATPIGSTGSTGSERFDTGSRTGSYSTGSIGSTGSSPYRGEPVNRTGSRTDEPHSHEGDRFGQAEPVETSDDHDELDADDEQPPSAPRPVELAPQSHKEPFTDDGDRPNAPKARRHHG